VKETVQDYKEREIENINAMGSRSRGVTGLRDVDSLNLILTPAQQKEIQKHNQENKMNKKYCLTVLKDGIYQELTDAEFQEFCETCPVVAAVLKDNSQLSKLPMPKINDTNTPLYDCWDKAAKRLINSLWRVNSAQIFHHPVDPDRLQIPDYFEIVKEPIDFGTIKQRLNHNYYYNIQDVVDDIQKCFDNCMLFNGEDSVVGERCMKVMHEFKKLY
tara:strand:- start:100 stop:747 length:648 start_codon:yes stop_codon:yes gene_type:complete